jgi:hypothetical protein
VLRDIVGKGIVWIWCAEQGLNGQQYRPDLERWRPIAYVLLV